MRKICVVESNCLSRMLLILCWLALEARSLTATRRIDWLLRGRMRGMAA